MREQHQAWVTLLPPMSSLTMAYHESLGGVVGQELAGAAGLRARAGEPVEREADPAAGGWTAG